MKEPYKKFPSFESYLEDAQLDIDLSHFNREWMRQVEFNTLFLKAVKQRKGSLVYSFCNKPDLIIYDWRDRSEPRDFENMATADHFNPKGKGGDPYNFLNLVVACYGCNNLKADKEYELESLKYLTDL